MRAYKNMENPSCIIIDASKSREEVCENAVTELKIRKIWPEDNLYHANCPLHGEAGNYDARRAECFLTILSFSNFHEL